MANPTVARPEPAEFPPAVANYIQLVPEGDLLSIHAEQRDDLLRLVGTLSDEQSLVRDPPYTWSIKQVVGHLTDCERVFGYRAMRLARNDVTPLAGFDENAYMPFADFDRCPAGELLAEFEFQRRSHGLLFRHFDAAAWLRRGVVNDHPMSVRAIAYVLVGHAAHHLSILHKRLGG